MLLDPPPARTAGYSLDTLEQMSRRLEVLLKHFGIIVQVVLPASTFAPT